MKIGKKTREKATWLISYLLDKHQDTIEKTYCETNGHMDISFKIRFEPAGEYGTKVSAKISFVESKVDDTYFEFVDEKQLGLGLDEQDRQGTDASVL